MQVFSDLTAGFEIFNPTSLLYVLIGVVIGMIVGVLPALGPTATIALLLPMTFGMAPADAIIMLAGIYYGAYYGGTVTAVVLKLPGEAASIVTTFDGYQMALRGRAGPALGISAIGSFIGGIVAVIGIMLIAPEIADFALRFGPPEYMITALIGLILTIFLVGGSPMKSALAAGLGLLIAAVGTDPVYGSQRFTFDILEVRGGFDFVAAVMGLFGLGEILYSLADGGRASKSIAKVGRVWPSRSDRRASWGPIGRGSVLGFFLGMLPGGGGLIPSIASYGLEKKVSKTPEQFGKGAIAGVAGPETANNSGSTSSFIPLLTLGLPPNAVLALIYGALLIHGITPGPALPEQHPELFWGVLLSMLVGNLILLALSLPFVGLFVQIVRVRLSIISAVIIPVAFAGVYSINNSMFDVWVMVAFGLLGYAMRKFGFEPATLVLALVLGPILEMSFRQSMTMSGGDPGIFVTRPIPMVLIIVMVVVLIVPRLVRLTTRARTKPDTESTTEIEDRAGRPS